MQENQEATTGTATATATATAVAPRTDRLELVKELPRGSVGVVHQAKNPQQDRSVALRKFDVPEWLEDVNDLLKRILTEARAATALDHPNIALFYFPFIWLPCFIVPTALFAHLVNIRKLIVNKKMAD